MRFDANIFGNQRMNLEDKKIVNIAGSKERWEDVSALTVQ